MENPYKVKDPSRVDVGQFQEREVVSIKDDSTKPPQTTGDPTGLGVYFGPLYGQPESSQRTFAHEKAKNKAFWLSPLFWLLATAFAIICYLAYIF